MDEDSRTALKAASQQEFQNVSSSAAVAKSLG
jgi:hypothetical protein